LKIKKFLFYFYRYNRDKNLSEEAINATATSNQSVNSSDSDDNPEKLMRMDFIAEMASRPQSTMVDTRSKPPLRLEMDKYQSMNIPAGMQHDEMERDILKWWEKIEMNFQF
jgi:hypothetical protein